MASRPPEYCDALTPPSYLIDPSPSERRLAVTPRGRLRQELTGTYVKSSRGGQVTVVLKRQDNSRGYLPTYGRRGVIEGELSIEDPENVLSVEMKIEGQLDVSRDGHIEPTILLADSHDLWKQDPDTKEPCPTILPFAMRLPATFKDGDRSFALPPSFFIFFTGLLSLTAKTQYVLNIYITRTRKLLREWVHTQNLTVYIKYHPRSRPLQPLIRPPLTFRSTLKPSPEEWCQICSVMSTREGSGILPIDCNLFIPASKTFAFSDVIPFHVQLHAPASSLRELYSESKSSARHIQRLVRVHLRREVTMEVRFRKYQRSIEFGDGELTPLAPPPEDDDHDEEDDPIRSLDWEGEIKCSDEVDVSGFRTDKLLVKDYIVLSVSPPNAQSSPLLPHRFAHAVTFVTDPFEGNEDRYDEYEVR